MGGGGKRNSKKKKEKSKQLKPHSAHGLAKECNFRPGGVSKAIWNELYDKLYSQYQKILVILFSMSYTHTEAIRAMMINGCMYGPSNNIFANILTNTMSYLQTGEVIDPRQCPDGEPILRNFHDAVVCLMQGLINEATEDDQECDDETIKGILSDRRVFSEVFLSDNGEPMVVDDCERLMAESRDSLRQLKMANSSSSSALQVHQQPENPSFELGSPSNTPPKESFDGNKMTISELRDEVEKLEKQLKDTKMWAEETVTQAGIRLDNHSRELHQLRSDYREKHEMSCTNDKEHTLKTLHFNLTRVNTDYKRFDVCNQEMKAEIAALQLNASENQSALKLVEKEEKKNLRMLKNSEKKVSELKRLIDQEKQNIAKTEQDLLHAEEAENHAKSRLMQEMEAKKQAKLLLLEEERLFKKEKEESKRRLQAVTMEVDAIKQRLLRRQNVVEGGVATSSRQYSCLFCYENMPNVLFLPCRHQVLCEECCATYLNILANGCPCCRDKIDQKIKVYVQSS